MPRPNPPLLILNWRYHDQTRVRAWLSHWAWDQFETMTVEQFEEVKRVFERFSIPVKEWEADEA